MGEKEVGEMIGGANLLAMVICWHQRRNAIDQLTLKVVLVGAEGQGKKSEGSKRMGQSGGA